MGWTRWPRSHPGTNGVIGRRFGPEWQPSGGSARTGTSCLAAGHRHFRRNRRHWRAPGTASRRDPAGPGLSSVARLPGAGGRSGPVNWSASAGPCGLRRCSEPDQIEASRGRRDRRTEDWHLRSRPNWRRVDRADARPCAGPRRRTTLPSYRLNTIAAARVGGQGGAPWPVKEGAGGPWCLFSTVAGFPKFLRPLGDCFGQGWRRRLGRLASFGGASPDVRVMVGSRTSLTRTARSPDRWVGRQASRGVDSRDARSPRGIRAEPDDACRGGRAAARRRLLHGSPARWLGVDGGPKHVETQG